jgi:heptosyltransferase-1
MSVLKTLSKYSSIDWIVEERFAQILSYNPYINSIKRVNLKNMPISKLYSEYRNIKSFGNYDMVIDIQGLLKSAIVGRMLSKNVLGFDRYSSREAISELFYRDSFRVDYNKNIVDRYSELINKIFTIDIEIDNKVLYFLDDVAVDRYISKNSKNIIIIVGASINNKIYPKEKFVELIKMLGQNIILVWGNDKEYNDAKYIAKNSDAIITDKLSINQLKALISKSDLVIGGDTGPTHMAWGLGVASITIFGNTPAYRNTVETKINRIIKSNSIINPRFIDKSDFSIRNINPSNIIDMAEVLL